MTFNLQDSIEMVSSQIKTARAKRKKQIKVKVYQLDYSGGKPHGLYMLTGMCKGGAGEKAIKDLGCSVSYEKTDKQITVGYKLTGEMSKCNVRPLHTTNMVIKL